MRYNSGCFLRSNVIGLIFILSACGGGGGGGGGSSAPPAPTTFPIAAAMYNSTVNGLQASYDLTTSAFLNGMVLRGSGSGTYAIQRPGIAIFPGPSNLAASRYFSGDVTSADGLGTFPFFESEEVYYDSNYNELGYRRDSSSDRYSPSFTLVTDLQPLPTAAQVNDAGSLDTRTVFSDPNLTTIYYTGTSTYKIEADTKTSAILHITRKFYNTDTDKTLARTEDLRYRIDTKGNVSFISFDKISVFNSIEAHYKAR